MAIVKLESTFSKAGQPIILGDSSPSGFGLTASEVNGKCHLKAGVDGALRGVKDDVSGTAGGFFGGRQKQHPQGKGGSVVPCIFPSYIKHISISMMDDGCFLRLTRWFQMICSSLPGEMIQFD